VKVSSRAPRQVSLDTGVKWALPPQVNEFERDNAWQQRLFDRVLRTPLQQAAYNGGLVVIDYGSPFARLVQRQAHVDLIAQTRTGGTCAIDVKLVRHPPSLNHWHDFFLETWSCTVPGRRAPGWLTTSAADFILWGQVSKDETAIDCFPLPLAALRDWTEAHRQDLRVRLVRNPIDGFDHWTEGLLAPIRQVCRDLQVTGFRVDSTGLVSDLFGKPMVRFLSDGAVMRTVGDAANEVVEDLARRLREP